MLQKIRHPDRRKKLMFWRDLELEVFHERKVAPLMNVFRNKNGATRAFVLGRDPHNESPLFVFILKSISL